VRVHTKIDRACIT